ncbi:hypothetical protein FKM82_013489 [Ascaphus truei]
MIVSSSGAADMSVNRWWGRKQSPAGNPAPSACVIPGFLETKETGGVQTKGRALGPGGGSEAGEKGKGGQGEFCLLGEFSPGS